MLSIGKSLEPNNTSNMFPITSLVFFMIKEHFSPSKINHQNLFIFAKTLLRHLLLTKINIVYLSLSESECALLVFPLICHLILKGCTFEKPTNS